MMTWANGKSTTACKIIMSCVPKLRRVATNKVKMSSLTLSRGFKDYTYSLFVATYNLNLFDSIQTVILFNLNKKMQFGGTGELCSSMGVIFNHPRLHPQVFTRV